MKVLHICLGASSKPPCGLIAKYRNRHKQPALRRAVASLGPYRCINWVETAYTKGFPALHKEIIRVSKQFKPDATFMQIQRPNIVPPAVCRQIPGRVMNWTGDVRHPQPGFYRALAPHVFTTSFTNMNDVDIIKAAGLRSDYLQVGFDERIYKPTGPKRKGMPPIVFMGGNYEKFPESRARLNMVKALMKRYGSKFVVFGRRWPFRAGFLQPPEEAAAYRGCRIAINQNHYIYRRFSSDRLFRALGCGPLVANRYFPEQELEFEDKVHMATWRTVPELIKLIDYYLDHEPERKRIADAGCALAHSECTWNARMQTFKKIMES